MVVVKFLKNWGGVSGIEGVESKFVFGSFDKSWVESAIFEVLLLFFLCGGFSWVLILGLEGFIVVFEFAEGGLSELEYFFWVLVDGWLEGGVELLLLLVFEFDSL